MLFSRLDRTCPITTEVITDPAFIITTEGLIYTYDRASIIAWADHDIQVYRNVLAHAHQPVPALAETEFRLPEHGIRSYLRTDIIAEANLITLYRRIFEPPKAPMERVPAILNFHDAIYARALEMGNYMPAFNTFFSSDEKEVNPGLLTAVSNQVLVEAGASMSNKLEALRNLDPIALEMYRQILALEATPQKVIEILNLKTYLKDHHIRFDPALTVAQFFTEAEQALLPNLYDQILDNPGVGVQDKVEVLREKYPDFSRFFRDTNHPDRLAVYRQAMAIEATPEKILAIQKIRNYSGADNPRATNFTSISGFFTEEEHHLLPGLYDQVLNDAHVPVHHKLAILKERYPQFMRVNFKTNNDATIQLCRAALSSELNDAKVIAILRLRAALRREERPIPEIRRFYTRQQNQAFRAACHAILYSPVASLYDRFEALSSLAKEYVGINGALVIVAPLVAYATYTPLVLAVISSRWEWSLRMLLMVPKDLMWMKPSPRLLEDTIKSGDRKILKMILPLYRGFFEERKAAKTPSYFMQLAARQGHYKMVGDLIKAGEAPDLDINDKQNRMIPAIAIAGQSKGAKALFDTLYPHWKESGAISTADLVPERQGKRLSLLESLIEDNYDSDPEVLRRIAEIATKDDAEKALNIAIGAALDERVKILRRARKDIEGDPRRVAERLIQSFNLVNFINAYFNEEKISPEVVKALPFDPILRASRDNRPDHIKALRKLGLPITIAMQQKAYLDVEEGKPIDISAFFSGDGSEKEHEFYRRLALKVMKVEAYLVDPADAGEVKPTESGDKALNAIGAYSPQALAMATREFIHPDLEIRLFDLERGMPPSPEHMVYWINDVCAEIDTVGDQTPLMPLMSLCDGPMSLSNFSAKPLLAAPDRSMALANAADMPQPALAATALLLIFRSLLSKKSLYHEPSKVMSSRRDVRPSLLLSGNEYLLHQRMNIRSVAELLLDGEFHSLYQDPVFFAAVDKAAKAEEARLRQVVKIDNAALKSQAAFRQAQARMSKHAARGHGKGR